MKQLLLAAALCFSATFASAAPVNTFSIETGDAFDFQVNSPCQGCVVFGYFRAISGFPYINGGVAGKLRFYYDSRGFEFVSTSSPYVEITLRQEADGSLSIPNFSLGNFPSGMRYFFKVGVVTMDNRMLFFAPTDNSDWDEHSVVIR